VLGQMVCIRLRLESARAYTGDGRVALVWRFISKRRTLVVALIALLLILAIFGGLGFAVHLLWIVLVVALVLWLLGFFIGGVADAAAGGRRRWYGRW
jgi:uncharacterized membrane protein YecN with MAPEG domain